MKRLKFEMWKDMDGDILSRFTDGKGRSTDSYWSSPPSSINHVGREYLPQRHRHPNVKNANHDKFIKRRFKEEMLILKPQDVESNESAQQRGSRTLFERIDPMTEKKRYVYIEMTEEQYQVQSTILLNLKKIGQRICNADIEKAYEHKIDSLITTIESLKTENYRLKEFGKVTIDWYKDQGNPFMAVNAQCKLDWIQQERDKNE